MIARLLLCLLLCSSSAVAQTASSHREVEIVRSLFDAGQYQQAMKKARDLLATQNFADDQRVQLNKYAGLSAYNLQDEATASDFLLRMLMINPDHVLDPFAVPPATIRFFEELKKKNEESLNLVRQQIALREEQVRRRTEEEERARLAEEEKRRRMEQLSQQITVRTVERPSFLVNFLPFGAGQFQQGRTPMGVVFATSEGALAATSIVSFLALESMFVKQTITLDDRLGGEVSLSVRTIPAERTREASVWRGVKYGAGIGFYAVYAYGVVDAILHHRKEVVTTTVEQRPADAPSMTPSKVMLYPTPDGLGAGLTFNF